MRNPNWREDDDRDERRNDPYGTGNESSGGRRSGREYETGPFRSEEGYSRSNRNMPSPSGPYPYQNPSRGGGTYGPESESGRRGNWRGGYGRSDSGSRGYGQGDYGSYGQDEYGPSSQGQREYGSFGGVAESVRGSRTYGNPGYGSGSHTDWNPGSFSGRTPNYGTEPGEFSGKGPKGYQRSDDRNREEVCDCLTDDGRIDASNVEVSVSGGEVTLSGTVSDRRQKREIEDLCERCSGVREVHNSLRVENESRRGNSSTRGQESSSFSSSPAGSQSGTSATKDRNAETPKR